MGSPPGSPTPGGSPTFTGGAISATNLQITGGTSTFSGGAVSVTTLLASGTANATFNNSSVTAATADFSGASAGSTVIDTGSAGLKINSTLLVKKGGGGVVNCTYTKGSGPDTFSASGSDLANGNADRTFTLGGGTLRLGGTSVQAFTSGGSFEVTANKGITNIRII